MTTKQTDNFYLDEKGRVGFDRKLYTLSKTGLEEAQFGKSPKKAGDEYCFTHSYSNNRDNFQPKDKARPQTEKFLKENSISELDYYTQLRDETPEGDAVRDDLTEVIKGLTSTEDPKPPGQAKK